MTANTKKINFSPGLFDVLRLPLIGRALRGRWGRLLLQIPLLIAAALLIYDGFTGQQNAAQNLATVAPWVHYRGLVVIALLLVGNLFCMGCPFTIPRTLAKHLSIRGRRFPQRLRSKWIAIASLFLMFFLYEWLDLWASPALTAWVIVFYFIASFVMEAVFTESAFCKYVCPLGTFNFVYSTASPAQIAPRNRDVCASCVGKECVNGSYSQTPVIRLDMIPVTEGAGLRTQRNAEGEPLMREKEVVHNRKGTLGCGTELFVPQIKSNLDCVFCLDCARACPHENVGLFVKSPNRELGRADAWPKRWDISFLVIFLAFMGLMNAFGMVSPVYGLMQGTAETLNLRGLGFSTTMIDALVLLILFGVTTILIPLVLVLAAAWLSRKMGQGAAVSRRRNSGAGRAAPAQTLRETVAAFAPAFVPIGFGVWIAHYLFHFLIGVWTIIPVFQNFLIDHRIHVLGEPNWQLGGLPPDVIGLVQTLALVGGFLWTMTIAQRTALRLYKRQAMFGLLPFALLFLGMMLVGLWLMSQPMEMRGTIFFD